MCIKEIWQDVPRRNAIATATLLTLIGIAVGWFRNFHDGFFTLAILWSLFYGLMALEIFHVDTSQFNKPLQEYIHQFWFNFVGSIAGWSALYVLFIRLPQFRAGIDAGDVLLMLFTVIGITGHLPWAVFSVLQALHDLAFKILGIGK